MSDEIRDQYYPLRGGLDLVTPAIVVGPGFARAVVNYEAGVNGYPRTRGYERLDGRPKPSDASFWALDFDAGTAAISEGDIITGATSGATGEALIDAIIETGSYVGNDATGYNIMVNLVGTFQDNENLQVSAVTKSVADGVARQDDADTDALNDTYLQDAIETTRADILTVPGSGNIRGVHTYNGVKYAFRDNAGATAVDMYKSSTAGWVLQVLGETMDFTSGGATEIQEEDTITGDTSGETATVKRIIKTSGEWANGDAAGRLILYSVSGVFTAAEGLEVSASNVATCTADSTVNTLAAGGRFEFDNYNFGGHAGTYSMYGVDGVSNGFEWDGSVFTPILTGMTTDTPKHLVAHKKHLFFSFTGGSVQHSGIGTPYIWTAITGAAELAIGEEVTGLILTVTRTLCILGRNTIAVLHGADAATWDLDILTDEAGAIEYTVQLIGQPIYMDDIGLRDLTTTAAFGDFQLGTLSRLIEPVFKAKKALGVTATASLRVRTRDQYLLFFSDGTGVSVYFGHQNPECMLFDLDKVVHCASSSEDANGNEVLLFGSTDGYVYELNVGTSFDGAAVDAFVTLPFNHTGTPLLHKQWRMAALETDTAIATVLSIFAEFGYGDLETPVSDSQDFTIAGGRGFWNVDNWNQFNWSVESVGQTKAHIEGEGTNVALTFASEKIYEEPHVLHGLTLVWSDLRFQM